MAHPSSDNAQMLMRGIACILIGAAVLLGPGFLSSPAYRDMVAGASAVGWFAIVLGAALVAVGLLRRWKR